MIVILDYLANNFKDNNNSNNLILDVINNKKRLMHFLIQITIKIRIIISLIIKIMK